LVFYEEYKFGHLSFLIPNSLKHYQDIVNLLRTFNPVYIKKRETLSEASSPSRLTDERMAERLVTAQSEVQP
jgi:HEPN domain-containing protein